MFRGESGGSASHEVLSHAVNQEAFDQDPQETECFLVPESQEVITFEGQVKIPSTDCGVNYSGTMPMELSDTHMNIVVPGFGGIKKAYQSFERHMASDEGLFTISYVPARSSSNKLDPQQVHEDTIGAITQDIADSGVLDDLPNGTVVDLSEFSATLHSMGAIAGTRYALNKPDELVKLGYLNPVGFEENGPFAKYLKRIGPCAAIEILPGFVKGDFVDHRSLTAGLKMGKHLLGNVVHTVGEVVTCHTSDLRRDVLRLDKMGVSSGIILGGKDRLVPAKASFKGASHLVDHCEIIEDLDHFGPQKRPRETAKIIAAMLAKLP